MSIEDGGPAFPGKEPARPSQTGFGTLEQWVPGMSLRDWFAGKALAGMFASDTEDWCMGENGHSDRALDAYKMADAMLEIRNIKKF